MTDKKEKPQRILSKSLLTHALLELLEDKPYEQITITALTMKADISRRTFYRHFSTIDETLDYILEQVAIKFQSFQAERSPGDLKSLIYIYFLYWQTRKDFLLILKKNDLLYRLQNKFIPAASTRKIDDEQYTIPVNDTLLGFAASFTSGAIWSLLVKWLDSGAVQSPEEMAEIAENILFHFTHNQEI